jgi:hypothetical protein
LVRRIRSMLGPPSCCRGVPRRAASRERRPVSQPALHESSGKKPREGVWLPETRRRARGCGYRRPRRAAAWRGAGVGTRLPPPARARFVVYRTSLQISGGSLEKDGTEVSKGVIDDGQLDDAIGGSRIRRVSADTSMGTAAAACGVQVVYDRCGAMRGSDSAYLCHSGADRQTRCTIVRDHTYIRPTADHPLPQAAAQNKNEPRAVICSVLSHIAR